MNRQLRITVHKVLFWSQGTLYLNIMHYGLKSMSFKRTMLVGSLVKPSSISHDNVQTVQYSITILLNLHFDYVGQIPGGCILVGSPLAFQLLWTVGASDIQGVISRKCPYYASFTNYPHQPVGNHFKLV